MKITLTDKSGATFTAGDVVEGDFTVTCDGADDVFVRVLRGEDDEFDGKTLKSWTWEGDPMLATFESAWDAMAAADTFHGRKLAWWEEEKDYWLADLRAP